MRVRQIGSVKPPSNNTIIRNSLDIITYQTLNMGVCSLDFVIPIKLKLYLRSALWNWGKLSVDKIFPRIRRGSF